MNEGANIESDRGGGKIDFPLPAITGPGPDSLLAAVPEDNKGFFGEATPSELITGTALTNLVSLGSVGIAQMDIDSIPWLKFIIDDKILFVAKRSLRYQISWNALNGRNIVNGTGGVTIGGYQYKIRLLKGIRPDPEGIEWSTTNYYNPEITHGSEWNRLFYNLLPETVSGYHDSQIGPDIANYNFMELGGSGSEGNYSWCQESWNLSTNKVVRGTTDMCMCVSRSPTTTNNKNLGWRPCLELIA